jgi:hypothetical protein
MSQKLPNFGLLHLIYVRYIISYRHMIFSVVPDDYRVGSVKFGSNLFVNHSKKLCLLNCA